MTEILFIRHGETDYNKKNLYYGHLNPGLNETGINQLKNTKKKLEEMNEKIDIVFSSDLKRCRQSLELLELDENIEKYFLEELRELNFGDIEGKSYDKIRKEFPHYIDEMKNNWKYFRTEGGESLDDLQKRVLAQNKKNRELLRTHITGLRQQIASLKRPYAHKESIYAGTARTAAIIDLSL